MTQHQQARTRTALNANLVALIFIINFVVIGGLIFSTMPLSRLSSDGGDTVAIAPIDPTSTPIPSSTPLPPTATPTPLPTQTQLPSATPTERPTTTSTAQVVAVESQADVDAPENAGYDPAVVEQGQQLFTLCAACHGPDARGLPNLGKDLVESEFVAAQTDDALVQFIITGRPIWDPLNTTGLDMPGKGGNPAMTTEEIQAIVAYLRTLSAEGSGEAEAVPVSNESIDYDPALVSEGEQLFALCAACHGPDARGLPNLGKDLVESEFVAGLTDEALLEFIKTGRPIWDPLNTTGLDMPGKGGNPAMTDEEILAIIAYVRLLSESNG